MTTKTKAAAGSNGKRRPMLPEMSPESAALFIKQREEHARNHGIFESQFTELVKTRRGQWAMMKNGKIVGFYPSLDEAEAAGDKRYRSRVYSLHEIDDTTISMMGAVELVD